MDYFEDVKAILDPSGTPTPPDKVLKLILTLLASRPLDLSGPPFALKLTGAACGMGPGIQKAHRWEERTMVYCFLGEYKSRTNLRKQLCFAQIGSGLLGLGQYLARNDLTWSGKPMEPLLGPRTGTQNKKICIKNIGSCLVFLGN